MNEKFIRSCLNYTGGKYRLLPQIYPLFPKDFNKFIDLFSGGAVIGINVANKYEQLGNQHEFIINDIEYRVIDFYRFLTKVEYDWLIKKIYILIEKYGLSNTYKHGYQHYGLDSVKGVGSYNKKGFLKLRKDYNAGVFKCEDIHIAFYLLIVYGFNNQIRFNAKGHFNLPVGKRDFNKNMREKLKEFQSVLFNHKFEFSSLDFREVKEISHNDFIYADPPYRITTASYIENGGWSVEDDVDLFLYLDHVDKLGANFALSNVVIHKGRENHELVKWASKYNLHVLNYNYNNSNYQSKAKYCQTVEVLITNY